MATQAEKTQRALATVREVAALVHPWLSSAAASPAVTEALHRCEHLLGGLAAVLHHSTRAPANGLSASCAATDPHQVWSSYLRAEPAALADLDTVPARVLGPVGAVAAADLLGLAVAELVLVLTEVTTAEPQLTPPLLPRSATTVALRTLTAALADRFPGHTIEVRIPPFAAVQCGIPGDGPSHTRGTPPNVIETDAATFVLLAAGRLSWEEARAAHRVTASGTRADLTALLPLWRTGEPS